MAAMEVVDQLWLHQTLVTVTAVAIRTIDHGPAIEIYAGAISTQLSLNLIGKRF